MAQPLSDHKAPRHLPNKLKQEWNKAYSEEKKEALRNDPDNPNAARVIALKAANKLLRVNEPTSAQDIAKMEKHEYIHRGEREVDGVMHATVVTADGKKFAFPLTETKKTDASNKS